MPIIELSPVPTGLSSLASQCLRYMPGELGALAYALSSDSPVTGEVAGVAAEEVERAREMCIRDSTCTLCAVGCRTAAQSSSDEIVRFLGVDSDPVNWGWLCDKGRFGFEALNSPERTAHPMARRVPGTVAETNGSGGDGNADKELVRVSWSEAFSEIASKMCIRDS